MLGMFFVLSWFDISFANTLLITLAKLIVKLSVLCEISQNSRYVEALKVFFFWWGYEITQGYARCGVLAAMLVKIELFKGTNTVSRDKELPRLIMMAVSSARRYLLADRA